MADGSVFSPPSPIQQAERDYAALVCSVDGVRQIDATLDIVQLAAIADKITDLPRMAWKNRPTSDVSSKGEFVPVLVAQEIGDLLAERLGLSAEASRVLEAQIQRAAQ